MTAHEQIKSLLAQIEQRENGSVMRRTCADVPKLRKALEMAVEALAATARSSPYVSEADDAKEALDLILTQLKS